MGDDKGSGALHGRGMRRALERSASEESPGKNQETIDLLEESDGLFL
jgi:hypothetical protein